MVSAIGTLQVPKLLTLRSFAPGPTQREDASPHLGPIPLRPLCPVALPGPDGTVGANQNHVWGIPGLFAISKQRPYPGPPLLGEELRPHALCSAIRVLLSEEPGPRTFFLEASTGALARKPGSSLSSCFLIRVPSHSPAPGAAEARVLARLKGS